MSKNLTRKGLAFGAVVALGTTLFAGAPAQAASVLFAPTTGTGNTLVAGETFSLTASLSSDLPASNSTQLKFKVANTTGVAATVTLNNKTIAAAGTYSTNTAGTFYKPVALDSSVGGTTAGSTLAAGTASAVYGVTDTTVDLSAAGTTAVVVGGVASTATNPSTIKIASASATTASYTVTAFLDANNNGAVDAGELSSAQTVNFVKVADSGLTTTFTKPSIASGALKAVLTFGADVNVQQLTAANYTVAYGLYGVSGKIAVVGANTNFSTPSGDAVEVYDAVDNAGKLISLATATTAPASGVTYSAQPIFGGALVASEVFQVVAASSDADSTALTVAPVVSNDVVLNTSTSYWVRAGVAATAVKATIKKTPTGTTVTATSGVAVGAGVVVNVTVSGVNRATASGATSADTITVNGTLVPVTGTYATTAVTDANGVVTVPVVTSAGTAADAITVTLAVANAAATATGSATLVWQAAALTAPVDLIVGSNSPVHTAVKGGSYTASYALRDQFNALYTGSAYRLVFTAPGAAGSTAPTSQTGYVPFVNGIATVTLTDNSTGAGINAASYIIEKQTNGLWAQAASPLNTTVQAPFTVTATARVAAAVTAVVSTANTAREVGTTFATVDQRVNFNGVAAPVTADLTALSVNTLGGQVTDASGVGVAGAQVTIAAEGVQFVSGSVYAVGSITVSADATGTYTVNAYSHTAGKVTFTVTSGAATKTASVTYAAAVQANLKTTTVTIPSTSQTGRAIAVVATVVDKFGNPVVGMTVSFSATGVGSLSAATAVTGDNGVAQVKLVTQQGEDGDAVITVSHKGADSANTTDAEKVDDFTSAKTVTFGVADANIDIVGKRVTAVASFSKGKTVSFYVDGVKKWSKVSTSDADVVLYYNLKKGTHTVAVKISGGFVTTERFIVK